MTPSREGRPLAALAPALLLCAIFALLVWPAAYSGRGATSEAKDQMRFHAPAVEQMAEQWPRPDVSDYSSATTPGYHLAMAAARRFVTEDWRALQIISSLFSLGLVLVVWRCAALFVGRWPAFALAAPLLFCPYFLGGAIWLVTDNAALLFVALALGGAAMIPPTPVRAARWALYATIAVLVRQIHLWVAAPVGAAILLMSPLGARAPRSIVLPPHLRTGWARTILAAAALAGPFIVVGAFVALWGGLTPPSLSAIHEQEVAGANPMQFALALALFGAFGAFFLTCFARSWREALRIDRATIAAALTGAALALVFPTSYDMAHGRWGGPIWELVRRLPDVADRSIVFPPLAALGGVIIIRAWRAASAAGRAREAAILLFGLLAWTAAQSATTLAFQRYFEPMLLILLAWLAALAIGRSAAGTGPVSPKHQLIRLSGPLTLALIELTLSGATLYRSILSGETLPTP